MRVLIVSSGKPDSEYPLNGNFEFDQATALASIGIDVNYIAVDLRSYRRKRKLGITHGVEEKVKWHVISIPLGALPVNFLCMAGRIALNYIYNKVFNNTPPPDVIHAHFTEIGYISSFLSKKKGIPLVITEHSSKMNQEEVAPAILHCANNGYTQASKVIAVSKKLSNNIKKKTGIDAIVIPNLIRSSIFSAVERVDHIGFRIATTSNLIPLKRTINLIKAIERVQLDYQDIRLDIIGDGPLRGELYDYVVGHNLKEKIFFHGYLPSKEIAKIYSETDLFVLVSSTETFGVVWVEAMMAGIPVIATKCGGPEDFVNPENGLLIDVDDEKQLEGAIIEMYSKRNRYQSTSIKEQMSVYTPDRVAERLAQVYESVCEK